MRDSAALILPWWEGEKVLAETYKLLRALYLAAGGSKMVFPALDCGALALDFTVSVDQSARDSVLLLYKYNA